MQQIFPSTALRSNQATVKAAARREPAVITENNGQCYLFMSEELLESRIRDEADEAAYAARMARGIRRAKEGIARGEFVVGAEAAIARAVPEDVA